MSYACADISNVFGLVLDAVRVVVLPWYAQEEYADPQSTMAFKLEDDSMGRQQEQQH